MERSDPRNRKGTLMYRSKSFGIQWPSLVLGCAIIVSLIVGLIVGQAAAKGPASPEPIHACTLLSVSDMAALVGAPVGAPRETHKEKKSYQSWMSMCNYDCEQKQLGIGLTLKPHGRQGGGAAAYAAHESELREVLGQGYKLEPVPALGEKAGWDGSTKQLTVFQGPLMVLVNIVGPKISASDAQALGKQIAAKLLERLPRP